jgi:hypothetical protein
MNRTANRIKNVVYFFIVCVFILGIYYYRDQVQIALNNAINKVAQLMLPGPCERPIQYSIENIDPRFGLSREQITKFAKEAALVWSNSASKTLFQDESGTSTQDSNLKINFIYDYRQQATEEMSKIGIVINNDKTTYNTLKAKYDSLLSSYNKEKSSINLAINAFNNEKDAYNKLIENWNKQGGAPKNEYNDLEQQRINLNAEAVALNERQKAFNDLVSTLNSVVIVMNRLVGQLNLNVKNYNTVGSKTGEEFNEGEYISDQSGIRINIYEFNDTNQLVRVLEHEFGHALGLSHVTNPKAVMYRLNEGTNKELTADDIVELKTICKIK